MVEVSDVRCFDPWDLEDARQEAYLAAYEACLKGLDAEIAARKARASYLNRVRETREREVPSGLWGWCA